jgi:sigma-B regulation protein RsbU (phosphoserine phosphatase)
MVDDKPENLYTLEKLFDDQDVDVHQATSGFEAVELTVKHDFAVAIVDVQMPEMDGYELVEFLRQNHKTKTLPVIFVSAIFSDEYHHRKGYAAGAVDFMSKPFNPDILVSKVKVFLELYHQRRQLQEAIRQLNIEVEERKRAEENLSQANAEIRFLNRQLEAENLRMSVELDVAAQIHQMILPRQEELQQVHELDIAGFMQPADEVGGDYYDVLRDNGLTHIGIGDVTGHGLESGVMMLMTQTAIRTLIEHGETDLTVILNTLNRTLCKNATRMQIDKNFTLLLAHYQDQTLTVAGQHEGVLIVRASGEVEWMDTLDLGFPIGVEEDLGDYFRIATVSLEPGDGVMLYTDGITEAVNMAEEIYGINRLAETVSCHWDKPAAEIKQAVIGEVLEYIGDQKVYDDLTLIVLKQK